MPSVTSTNASGMANLVQVLSGSDSPFRPAGLSSSSLQSTLKNASAGDIVQLSDQALRLQISASLFGSSNATQTATPFSTTKSTPDSSSLLASAIATLTSSPASTGSSPSTSSSSTSEPTVAERLASYQVQLRNEQLQTLFGLNSNANPYGNWLNTYA
jgi:hypothetical protein